MKHKVLAYITRREGHDTELLVFTHRDFPEAGIQVPGGTVMDGEPPEVAALREVHEESGLSGCRILRHLATRTDIQRGLCRHVYQLSVPADTRDTWQHVVSGDGEDEGLVFCYQWLRLDSVATLAGDQHRWLGLLRETPASA